MDTKKVIGERLRGLREEKKLTRQDLENNLGIKIPSIAAYESGVQSPPVDSLIKIADFFEVSLDYLTGRSDQRNTCETVDISEYGEMDEDTAVIFGMISWFNSVMDKKTLPEINVLYKKISENKKLNADFKNIFIAAYNIYKDKWMKKLDG